MEIIWASVDPTDKGADTYMYAGGERACYISLTFNEWAILQWGGPRHGHAIGPTYPTKEAAQAAASIIFSA